MNNEILNSVNGTLLKRMNTPIYGTFLFSWAFFHWGFLYTTMFVSETLIFEKTGLLKHEYLRLSFFNLHDWYFYFAWAAPFALTYLIIWQFPKWILLPAFEREEEYRVNKINLRLQAERRLLKAETEVVEQQEKKLAAVEKKVTREKSMESADPRIAWEREYQEFKETIHIKSFYWIVESIYKHNGAPSWYLDDTEASGVEVPQTILAYTHSHGLIDISRVKGDTGLSRTVISLTEKGKFFMAKYTQEEK